MLLQEAILLCCLVAATFSAEVFSKTNNDKITYLEAGSIIESTSRAPVRGFFDSGLDIYCYRGNTKTLGRLFETVELLFEFGDDDYTQYEGSTPAEVRLHQEEQRSLFSFSLFSQKRTRLLLSPFVQQCIGIETPQPYKVQLQQLRVDFWRVIKLAAGVFLFLYAGHLSHNSVFYYITGISLGICSSFMLLIWLSSKLVPRRTMMYGVLIGGWTIGLYIVQMLWDNLQLIVLTYRNYVLWYILITGVVSFFFCYRLGPPKNKRSKDIVKWLLQLMALLVIYFTSYFEEAMVAIIILTIVIHYFPASLIRKTRTLINRRFPPKRRLLSSEEYYAQGVVETTKALSELRAYASSPECKQWRVMAQLKDPRRFAAFVEGASHLRDEEILRFQDIVSTSSDNSVEEDGSAAGERSAMYRTVFSHEEMSSDEEEDEYDQEGHDIQLATSSRLTHNTLNMNRSSRSSVDRSPAVAPDKYIMRHDMSQNNSSTDNSRTRARMGVLKPDSGYYRQGKENRTLNPDQ